MRYWFSTKSFIVIEKSVDVEAQNVKSNTYNIIFYKLYSFQTFGFFKIIYRLMIMCRVFFSG